MPYCNSVYKPEIVTGVVQKFTHDGHTTAMYRYKGSLGMAHQQVSNGDKKSAEAIECSTIFHAFLNAVELKRIHTIEKARKFVKRNELNLGELEESFQKIMKNSGSL